MDKTELAARRAVIEEARRHVGYKSAPLKTSVFSMQTDHGASDWNGSFVRVVFDRAGFDLNAASTVQLLAELTESDRLRRAPRAGDLVFYAFPADGEHFGQPHVGIVTDADEYRRAGEFTAVEGQTATGNRRGDQSSDFVAERLRFETDVLTFASPFFRAPAAYVPSGVKLPWVRTAQFVYMGRHKSVEILQQALEVAVGLRMVERGLYDAKTRSAMAAYQRRLGFAGDRANGLPDAETLISLGAQTQLFDYRG